MQPEGAKKQITLTGVTIELKADFFIETTEVSS